MMRTWMMVVVVVVVVVGLVELEIGIDMVGGTLVMKMTMMMILVDDDFVMGGHHY